MLLRFSNILLFLGCHSLQYFNAFLVFFELAGERLTYDDLFLDDWPERDLKEVPKSTEDSHCNEVKNLKVCIELTGLHPKKQRHLQHLRELGQLNRKELCDSRDIVDTEDKQRILREELLKAKYESNHVKNCHSAPGTALPFRISD